MAFGAKKSGSSFKAKPRARALAPSTGRHDHEYHVVWDEAAKLWNVERDDDATGLSARQQSAAVDMAIHEARQDHTKRLDVIVELATPGDSDCGPVPSGQIVSLPWSKKAGRATKGIALVPAAPVSGSVSYPQMREPLLAAVSKARSWVDKIMAGATAAEIARQERKSERYIRMLVPLAFLPPQTVRDIVEGRFFRSSIHELARTVSLGW